NLADVLQRVHRLPVNRVDHVAILDADFFRKGIFLYERDHHAAAGIDVLALLLSQGARPEAEFHVARGFRLAGDRLDRLAVTDDIRTVFVKLAAVGDDYFERYGLPVTIDAQSRGVSYWRVGDVRDEIVAILYWRPVNGRDDISGPDSALIRRTALGNALDDRSVSHAQGFQGYLRLKAAVQAHAQRPAGHPPDPDDIVISPRDHIDRQREADAFRAASAGRNHGVDANHFAADIQQRSPAVAGINGGVGLDEMLEGPRAELRRTASDGADDARRDRRLQAERRPDRDRPVSHLHRVGIGDRDRL